MKNSRIKLAINYEFNVYARKINSSKSNYSEYFMRENFIRT